MSKTCRQMTSKFYKNDSKTGTDINQQTMRTNDAILIEFGRFWKGYIIKTPLVSIGFNDFERCEKTFKSCVKSDPQFIKLVAKSMPENETEKGRKMERQ